MAKVFTCCLASIFLHATDIPLAETPFTQVWNPEKLNKERFEDEVVIQERSLPEIETPSYGASNTYVGKIVAKEKLETTLVDTTAPVAREEKEVIEFKQSKELPHLEVKEISISSGPLKSKLFLASERYPEFVPFSQSWLKDPLNAFTQYREQMTTKAIMNNPDWSVEDSLLDSFLQSSISRLHFELDVKPFSDVSTLSEGDSSASTVSKCVYHLPLLPTSFPLSGSLNLYLTRQFSDMPLFSALVNRESERELMGACFERELEYDELDTSFATSAAWEDNLIGRSLQILSNREAKSLFDCQYEDSFSSPMQAETLTDLLASKESIIETFESPSFENTFFENLNYLSYLAVCDIHYNGQLSFHKYTQLEMDEALIPDDVPIPLSLFPDTEREGPFGFTETISTYATTLEDDFIDVDTNFAAFKQSMAIFAFSVACSETSYLYSSSYNARFHCPLTLAGVYTEDFFLPVSRVSQKSNIETIFLENKMPARHLLVPDTQADVSWIEIDQTLTTLIGPEDQIVSADTFFDSAPDKVAFHTIEITYENGPSPFYTLNTTLPSHVNEIEFSVAKLSLDTSRFFYSRPPFDEISDYEIAPALTPNLFLENLNLSTHSCNACDFTTSQFVGDVIASLEHNPFQKGNWVQWYSQSFTSKEISSYAHSRKMATSKIMLFDISSTFIPKNEAMRFDIGQFSTNIFKDTEFEVPQNQFASLSILKSAQEEVVAAVKAYSSPLYSCRASITATTYNTPPPVSRVRRCKHIALYDKEDAFTFVRNVSYDQRGALLAYQTNTEESVPSAYYLLPQLDLTRIAFLSLTSQEPDLLTTQPFSEQAVLRELARGKNQVNRCTHLNLCSIPSLEFLLTDSLGDEFDSVVRVLPMKNGRGNMFSVVLSPFNKESVDTATNHMYFLLDRSSTMEEHRFYTFKKALSQTLTYLDEGTPFNIALFDYETEWLNSSEVVATKTSINHIRKKLKPSKQRGKSNIQTFASLIEHIKERAYRTGEPHTVILLSDGRFMKNIRLQKNTIRSITDNIPDAFSLYAASASDNNNLGMLDLITGLCSGDAVHAKTHSSFTRKLASLTKRVHRPVGYCVKVTQIGEDNTAQILENSALSRSLYADKVFKIYGETSSGNDINLMIQAYNGERWLNIPKKISFQNTVASPTRLASDMAREKSLLDFLYFLQSGNTDALNSGQQRLISNHLPAPIR